MKTNISSDLQLKIEKEFLIQVLQKNVSSDLQFFDLYINYNESLKKSTDFTWPLAVNLFKMKSVSECLV